MEIQCLYYLYIFKLLVESKENWRDIILDVEAKAICSKENIFRLYLTVNIVDGQFGAAITKVKCTKQGYCSNKL